MPTKIKVDLCIRTRFQGGLASSAIYELGITVVTSLRLRSDIVSSGQDINAYSYRTLKISSALLTSSPFFQSHGSYSTRKKLDTYKYHNQRI